MILWHPQEQRASCVAACIRMVLSGFGQHSTEKELRRKFGQSPFGLSLEEVCKQLQGDNVIAEFHTDWNLIDMRDCLRDGWHPIIGIERRFFGHPDALHAVVLIEITSHSAVALDPLGNAQPEMFNLQTFEKAWADAGRQALVIKSPFPQIGEIKP